MGRYLVFLCVFILFLGLPGAANTTPISDFETEDKSSLLTSTKKEIKVIGNRESKIYYLPGMKFPHAGSDNQHMEFNSETDAIKAGYKKAPSGTASTTTMKDIHVNNKRTTPTTAMQKIKVIGNQDSKRYHLPGMKFYNAVEAYHRVEFDSEADAIKAGYHKAPR